jgi:hypothetical protein
MKTRMFGLLLFLILPVSGSCQPPQVHLDLRSAGHDHTIVQRGMPVILNVVLFSTDKATPDMILDILPDSLKQEPSYRMKLDSALSHVAQQESEKQRFERIIFDYQAPGQSRSFTIRPIALPPFPDDQATSTGPYFIDFGVDPDETGKWKEGTIWIRAGLPLAETTDTIWSDSLSIKVLDPALTRIKDYNNEQLIYVGNFWLRRGMCEEADLFAEELIIRDSIAYQTKLLKAEVFTCKNDLEQALEMFNKTIDAFYEQADPDLHPPEYLQEMIINLQNRLQMLKPK